MTLFELIHKVDFDSIVPHLTAIDPENVSHNLYAFKEAFDELRRMVPGDSGGEQIVVSTQVDIDNDGNEIDRYLHASHCEGDTWEACLAKEVILGTAVREEKALAQILWHITFRDFTPKHEVRSISRLERMGKVRRLIDRIQLSEPGYALCPENRLGNILKLNPEAEQVPSKRFHYLFDTVEISTLEFYSRTVLKEARAA